MLVQMVIVVGVARCHHGRGHYVNVCGQSSRLNAENAARARVTIV